MFFARIAKMHGSNIMLTILSPRDLSRFANGTTVIYKKWVTGDLQYNIDSATVFFQKNRFSQNSQEMSAELHDSLIER